MRRALLALAALVVLAGVGLVGCAVLRHGSGTPGAAGSSGSSAAGPATTGETTPGASPSQRSCVDTVVTGLGPDGQVGQLLMIGTPIGDLPALADTVRRYRLGGVFLAGQSMAPAASLHAEITTLQKAAPVPLLVATDQEGGEVQRLKGTDFPPIPSALVQGQWDQATLRSRTADWAGRLRRAGITMDLAPVADTVPAGTEAANPPIGALNRQYGADPDAVARDITTVVGAAQSAGVVTTLKHFPGLGRVRANTDTSTQAVDAVTTFDDPYLRPFAAGIKAGTGAVMVSSARYPKLDPNAIAAFSFPVVTGLLRQRLGFTGVVISDDLGAAVAVRNVAIGDRAVRFVRAGGDLVLTIRPTDAGPMAAALLAAAHGSAAFAARVTDAARHVVAAKVRAGLVSC
jgi:beta-N-acetylhexosaminidase